MVMRMKIKNSLLIVLVIVALLSGCVSKGAEISGTYTNTFREIPQLPKESTQEFTFYADDTWFYQMIGRDSNSGVYTIHDNEILCTASIGSENFKIQKNGSLIDSKNRTWIKKT